MIRLIYFLNRYKQIFVNSPKDSNRDIVLLANRDLILETMTDNSLIKKCQSGDSQAFEMLINQHYDTIYRFAYRWCGEQNNAQDITQNACLKLARAIKQYRFESSFTSWLYQLVINCAKDFYKSPSQHNTREEQHEDSDLCNLEFNKNEDANAKRVFAQQILEHITQLQDDLKDTLILIYGTGLNHKEAAKLLNIKESTVSWRVHEARKLLKQTFNSTDINANSSIEPARGLA